MNVLTFDGTASSPCRVVWTGRRHVRVGHGSDNIDHYPVRIMRDAVAPGVPARDLIVTSEHSVVIEGLLIPARMLVNGTSITVATELAAYTVHHIETEDHAIVLANGLLSESYLDTGNRSSFTHQRGVVTLRSQTKSWERDAAATLVTDRVRVEPVWRRLASRAGSLGLRGFKPARLHHSPSFAVYTGDGTLLDGELKNGWHVVSMPPGTTTIQLVSRSSRPSDVLGPFVDDRRCLGVLVGRVIFRSSISGSLQTVAHLADPDLAGWHAREHVGAASRWTNGCAMLHIDPAIVAGGGSVEIEILAGGPYLDRPAPILREQPSARIA